MFRFLRDKFIGLGRDEDGAALVITLAFFMFLYVLFLGIWAVGTNVRTRIHLQNACDAAAYSAAVVQADTLSRIATINRVMSWTYAQMTKRQMDYIVYKWLDHANRHYRDDMNTARAWHSGTGCGDLELKHNHEGIGWRIAADCNKSHMTIKINEKVYDENLVNSALNNFGQWMNRNDDDDNGVKNRDSFFHFPSGSIGIIQLGQQIEEDKKTISGMNAEIDSLVDSLPKQIQEAADTIVQANLSGYGDAVVLPQIKYDGDCFRSMQYSEESSFLSFSGSSSAEFESGHGTWFPLHEGEGFFRKYTSGLVAEWVWWAAKWICEGWVHNGADYTFGCKHKEHQNVKDHCKKFVGTDMRTWYKATLTAANVRDINDDDCFNGERANPRVLKDNYFGPAGTITIGLVTDNQNPWSWLGDVAHRGLLSAFEPFVSKTFCVASAKAGYRRVNVHGGEAEREYRVDWEADEASWNLWQSDWDAVMIPVPRAASQATGGAWMTMGDALSELAAKLELSEDDFRAGGTHVYTVKFMKDDEEDAYYWNQYLDLTVKDYVKRGAAVRAKWQIENPGRAISSWSELQKRMWH